MVLIFMYVVFIFILYIVLSEVGEKIFFGVFLFLFFMVFLLQLNGDLFEMLIVVLVLGKYLNNNFKRYYVENCWKLMKIFQLIEYYFFFQFYKYYF